MGEARDSPGWWGQPSASAAGTCSSPPMPTKGVRVGGLIREYKAGAWGYQVAGVALRWIQLRVTIHVPHLPSAGPSTVAGMAAAKGWSSSLVPSILTSTLGYALGTFVGMGLGQGLLRRLG